MSRSGRGSSPRARGTVTDTAGSAGADRFIPACAGNSGRRQQGGHDQSVHPRVRGEQQARWTISKRATGSSPRARGTAEHVGAGLVVIRFIPACAGNSWIYILEPCRRPVHPRVRGEQPHDNLGQRHACGSSPRARGTGTRTHQDRLSDRFIPACAGNRPRQPGLRFYQPVHPRVRGEQQDMGANPASVVGSSPRARGTVTYS